MNKKQYFSPLFIGESEDLGTSLKPSEGNSKKNDMYTIDEKCKDFGELNCNDIDLVTMDTDDNLVITKEEYNKWSAQ